jgi:hypothetical protein
MRSFHPPAANGLNAVGKPFGANYDPNYRMQHKPSYGHLRVPYPTTMRFVDDPPNYNPNTKQFIGVEPRKLSKFKRLRPVPLLGEHDPLLEHVAKLQADAQTRIKAQARALKRIKTHLDAAQKIFELLQPREQEDAVKKLSESELPDAFKQHLAGAQVWLVVSSADDEELLGPYTRYDDALAAAEVVDGSIFTCNLCPVARE